MRSMGCLESGFAPGILLLLSSWYKKEEQSKRFAVYISAAILSGAFGGLLAGAITGGLHDVNGIAGWRWLFIVEGAATVGAACVAFFILPDFPATSKRKFNDRERALAVRRLQSDEQAMRGEEEPKLGHLAALKLAMVNWRTWLFVIGYMVGLKTRHFLPATAFTNASQHRPSSVHLPCHTSTLPSSAVSATRPPRLST